MQRTVSAGSVERPAGGRGDALGHVAGRDEGGVVDVDARAAAGQRGGLGEQVVEVVAAPRRAGTPGAATARRRCAGTGCGRRRRPRW